MNQVDELVRVLEEVANTIEQIESNEQAVVVAQYIDQELAKILGEEDNSAEPINPVSTLFIPWEKFHNREKKR